jgi:hypothetical protein
VAKIEDFIEVDALDRRNWPLGLAGNRGAHEPLPLFLRDLVSTQVEGLCQRHFVCRPLIGIRFRILSFSAAKVFSWWHQQQFDPSFSVLHTPR